ncbi:MAG: hypothetical protein U9N81_10265 [Bacillota bacterium]|nr:hypothetical protein [Bacillota bacterium]
MKTLIEVGTDVINNEVVIRMIQAEIDQVNDQVEEYEKIKTFKLLNRRLTEEASEVTASMKLKSKVIQEKYKDIIDTLYL